MERPSDEQRHDTAILRAEGWNENDLIEYGWRVLEGIPRLVVLRMRFTLHGHAHEDGAAFAARMLRLATQLTLECDYTVVALTIHRRDEQRPQAWAEFECETPEYGATGAWTSERTPRSAH